MKTYINPPKSTWEALIQRPIMDHDSLEDKVKGILKEVKLHGNEALIDFTERFDKVKLNELVVSNMEIESAASSLSLTLKEAITVARNNIEAFHRTQKEELRKVETMPGVICWRKSIPIERVGLYIPGGTAPLFSSILMLGVPAVLAGCETIVLCTPPNQEGNIHPAILYTAHLLGIQHIYKVGGAQAIAAMAYGTESVPKVDKIFGPGNQYVTMAKQLVSQENTAIDMPAGPSEVAVVADETVPPSFVAADLLSQAEHGIDSQVLLLTLSETLVESVQQELQNQLEKLPRREIAQKALSHSKAIILQNQQELADLINLYAPEHLILSMEDHDTFSTYIRNAGSIFLGLYTPESVGDYASGTNHTLPTNGYARSFSGVSLDSYVKKITFQKLTPEGLRHLGPHVEAMAEAESLIGHKHAVRVRLEKLNNQEQES